MSTPSFEKINYSFRPAKHAQRKMLCEALQRLGRLAPPISYRYVGFGSVAFHDFSLFHQRLGISDMVSIERDERAKKRLAFNRPYSCIRIKWGWSYDVLPEMSWEKRAIVWLDYEHPLSSRMLGDVALLSSTLRSGSMLLITVPVDPDDGGDGPRERLADLVSRMGEERVPQGIRGTALSGWGTAQVSRDIIDDEIRRTLIDRNDALPTFERVRYRQLFNFQYADGKRMLTVGGLLCNDADIQQLGLGFDGLDFIRTAKKPYRIEAPILTLRELRFLDSKLPASSGGPLPDWLPIKERQRYSKLYRHFPSFGVVET